jgi:hypothetical protein
MLDGDWSSDVCSSDLYEDLSRKTVKNKKIDSRLRDHEAAPKDDTLDIPELTLIVTKTN